MQPPADLLLDANVHPVSLRMLKVVPPVRDGLSAFAGGGFSNNGRFVSTEVNVQCHSVQKRATAEKLFFL